MRKPRVAAVQSMTPCQAAVQKFQTQLVPMSLPRDAAQIAKRILNPKTRKLSGIPLCQRSHGLFRGRQWCQNKLQSSSGLAKWNLQKTRQHHVMIQIISNTTHKSDKSQVMSKAPINTTINDDASSAAVFELDKSTSKRT